MDTGLIVVIFLIAIVIGVLIEQRKEKRRTFDAMPQGILYVDCGDSGDSPSMYLESSASVSDIMSKKQVVFDVRVIRHNSHE